MKTSLEVMELARKNGFPEPADGKTTRDSWVLLLITCHVSSKYWGYALPDGSLRAVGRALADFRWREGIPVFIYSDNGSVFRSTLKQAVKEQFNVLPLFIPLYKPSANGKVERGNGIVKKSYGNEKDPLQLQKKLWRINVSNSSPIAGAAGLPSVSRETVFRCLRRQKPLGGAAFQQARGAAEGKFRDLEERGEDVYDDTYRELCEMDCASLVDEADKL